MPNPMPRTQPSRKAPRARSNPDSKSPPPPSAFERAMRDIRTTPGEFTPVSPRWLFTAIAVVLVGALTCAWAALCLLFWQGSWQLLYHPKATITRTPRDLGLAFESVRFPAEAQSPLNGWYLPPGQYAQTAYVNPGPGFTVLYLHGADGNLSDTLNTLAAFHRNHLAIFAIDYRGYGPNTRSSTNPARPIHPSESSLRQDAEWALTWLTLARSTQPKSILICGSGLGANLAARLASDHPELAGLILDQPLENPLAAVLHDPRSRLVPASLMMKDRYDLTAAAASLKLPSLWLFAQPHAPGSSTLPGAYKATPFARTAVWLSTPANQASGFDDPHFDPTLSRWLENLPASKPAD